MVEGGGKSDGPSVFAIGGTCEFPGILMGSLVCKILGERMGEEEEGGGREEKNVIRLKLNTRTNRDGWTK